jgi:hypothetical protein
MYIIESSPCGWNYTLTQFPRAYAAMSIAKHFWNNSVMGLCVCDGTFTINMDYKHILLIPTMFDPNNQITLLTIAAVECEDAHNCVWFKEVLERDFHEIDVWMSNADKDIYSNSRFLLEYVTNRRQYFSFVTVHPPPKQKL